MLAGMNDHTIDIVLEHIEQMLSALKVNNPRVVLTNRHWLVSNTYALHITFTLYTNAYSMTYQISDRQLSAALNPSSWLLNSVEHWLKAELSKIDRTETWELVPKT